MRDWEKPGFSCGVPSGKVALARALGFPLLKARSYRERGLREAELVHCVRLNTTSFCFNVMRGLYGTKN